MVLRYYRWLPLELEPDYKEGYTCDHCHKEFLEAPFFHEESTGTDYCVECGESAGYVAESGIVASLLFTSNEEIYRDSETNAIAAFAYRLDAQTFAVYFVNSCNIVLHTQLGGVIRHAVVYTVTDGRINSKFRLTAGEVSRRLPWLSAGVAAVFDTEIHLHTLPAIPVPVDDLCVMSYDADDKYIRIRLTEGYTQTLDVAKGQEIISKESMAICVFSASAVDQRSKSEGNSLLHEVSCEDPKK